MLLELPWNGACASYAAADTRRVTIEVQCSDRGVPDSLVEPVRVSETGKFAQQTPRDRCSPTHIPARTALRPYSTRENAAQTAPQPSQPPLPGDLTSTSRSLLRKTGLFGNKIRAAAPKIAPGEPQPTAPILLVRRLTRKPANALTRKPDWPRSLATPRQRIAATPQTHNAARQ